LHRLNKGIKHSASVAGFDHFHKLDMSEAVALGLIPVGLLIVVLGDVARPKQL